MSSERDDPKRPPTTAAPTDDAVTPSAEAVTPAEATASTASTASAAPVTRRDPPVITAEEDALPPAYHEPLPVAEAAELTGDYPTIKNEGSSYSSSYRPRGDEDDAPPPYSENLGRIESSVEGLSTQAAVAG
jgi:hypothetical protein